MQTTTTAPEVKPTVQNGNGQPKLPSVPPAADTPVQRPFKPTTMGRIVETLAAALFAGWLVVLGMNLESWVSFVGLAALSLVLGFVVFKIALRLAEQAAVKEEGLRKKKTYKVTWRRLGILEKVGVPEDVIAALQFLLPEEPMTEDKFFDTIATDPNIDLGIDRANEFRYTILKYTEVMKRPAPDPKPSNQSAAAI